jgi:hypothetical protein
VNSCGGLVAAVGVLFAAALGLLTTLPGSPVALLYPPWFAWTLRLAPVPALLLLWAVALEADFRVRTDRAGILFRQGLGAGVRVPWRGIHDYFADCGRAVRDVAQAGGSFVGPEPAAAPSVAPFREYRPDYILLTERGPFVFNDEVARLGILTEEIVGHAPPEAPTRWEEGSWHACDGCGRRIALSLWPRSADSDEALEPFRCPACGRVPEWFLDGSADAFVIQLRGASRPRYAWPGELHEAGPQSPEPVADGATDLEME